jgi:hypothetical protein
VGRRNGFSADRTHASRSANRSDWIKRFRVARRRFKKRAEMCFGRHRMGGRLEHTGAAQLHARPSPSHTESRLMPRRPPPPHRNLLQWSLVVPLVLPGAHASADQRLPYHQIAQSRRARVDNGKRHTNSSLDEVLRNRCRTKCRNVRIYSGASGRQTRLHLRDLVCGGGGGIRTMNLPRRIHMESRRNSVS